jgi:oligopeptide/dipeptide ABC transporter, ATP-binding protein, C-terminal domain
MADKEELKKTSVPGEETAEKPKKKTSYISAKESRRITKFNRKITKKLEHDREEAGKDPAYYTTKMRDPNNVVEFDNMCTYFFSDVGTVKAVDGISFDVPKCSTVGVVGESGCGKSVTSLSLMQLLQRPSGQTVGGEIRLNMGDGTALNIVNTPVEKMQELRGNSISMIFQEPMTALNPVFRIGRQVNEVIELHNPEMTEEQVKARTMEMLELVGIANKEGVYEMYPHELSGGMRQRVCIAIALACRPGLIIADEPTTALDVTIQAQILDLLQNLKDKINSSIMLITHDLGVVAGMADYVVVMYAGRVIEKGTADDIFHHPAHPYTIGLMKSKPVVGKKVEALYNIPGAVPNPVDMPNYCYFRDRCEMHCEHCSGKYPPEIRISDTHVVSCYRYFDEGEVLGYPKTVDVEELLNG